MLRYLALILMAATTAQAQTVQCGERAAIVQSLTETHHETRRGIGLASNGAVAEVWASAGGSWTITVTLPEGPMCLLASGQHYEVMIEALPAEGDPA